MGSKQLYTVLGVLAFLGTGLALVGLAIAFTAIKAADEKRLASWTGNASGQGWLFGGKGLARKVFMVAAILALGYSGALFAASIGSREWSLKPGSEKYFCEFDCHLAYAVTGVRQAPSIGPESAKLAARGTFYIVSVRTRFDETTISPHRGNGPLDPSPRQVTLVDAAGNSYAPSEDALSALQKTGVTSTPIMEALRPGESYISIFVFDLPANARIPRLLIETTPGWPDFVLIGGEESLFHKKVYLQLPG